MERSPVGPWHDARPVRSAQLGGIPGPVRMGIPAATPALFLDSSHQVCGRTMFGPVFIKIARPAAAAHCAGRRLQAGGRMPVRYRGRRHMPRLESAPCAACHDLRVLIANLIRHGQQERGGEVWRRAQDVAAAAGLRPNACCRRGVLKKRAAVQDPLASLSAARSSAAGPSVC